MVSFLLFWITLWREYLKQRSRQTFRFLGKRWMLKKFRKIEWQWENHALCGAIFGLTTTINSHPNAWQLNSFKSLPNALNLRLNFFPPRNHFFRPTQLEIHSKRAEIGFLNHLRQFFRWDSQITFEASQYHIALCCSFRFSRAPTHVCRFNTHSAKLRIKHFNYTVQQWRILNFPFLLHSPNSLRACFGARFELQLNIIHVNANCH